MKNAIIQVYTGNGKGKTTAAMGAALRAAGQGYKVAVFQFLKLGKYIEGEQEAFKKIKRVKFIRFNQESPIFNRALDKEKLKKTVKKDFEMVTQKLASGSFGLVVLDELTHVVNLKLLDAEYVVKSLKKRHKNTDVIITGRDCHKKLMECADLITDMRPVKHPYTGAAIARKGIEF